MNLNFSELLQSNYNESDHDSSGVAFSDTSGNAVLGGLIAANLLNPATSTAAGVNLSPVTQATVSSDIDAILDADVLADIL